VILLISRRLLDIAVFQLEENNAHPGTRLEEEKKNRKSSSCSSSSNDDKIVASLSSL
jgi:hypothetical protein